MIAPSRPLADILEKEWQQQVVQLFRTLGWTGFHTFDSRRSNPGFPDLIIVRERLVALELKREKGNLSDKQREWLRSLTKAGVEVYVARPRHLEERTAREWPLGVVVEEGVRPAFFFKQWGEWAPGWAGRTKRRQDRVTITEAGLARVPEDSIGGAYPGHCMERIGKKQAGRHLDGRTWSEFPTPITAAPDSRPCPA